VRCLFSHPELLKGTRLHQVRVLDCPVHLIKFGLLNSRLEYPATSKTRPWGIPLVAAEVTRRKYSTSPLNPPPHVGGYKISASTFAPAPAAVLRLAVAAAFAPSPAVCPSQGASRFDKR
jgi:hypothetical protein